METSTALPKEVVQLVASATTDLFNAPNMVKVAEIFKNLHQEKADQPSNFNEIIVNGSGTVYLLLRLPYHANLVCVFSCKDNGNTLGMMLREAHMVVPQVEKAYNMAHA